MAYYIKDNFDKISSRQGVKLIEDYLIKHKENVHIELRHVGTPDEVILIQTLVNSTGDTKVDKNGNYHYSNTVSLHTQTKQVTINPVTFDGINSTTILKDFVESIPTILRDQKLESLLA